MKIENVFKWVKLRVFSSKLSTKQNLARRRATLLYGSWEELGNNVRFGFDSINDRRPGDLLPEKVLAA
jgi:hypothetical protein